MIQSGTQSNFSNRIEADVAIVGAGFAGAAAAYHLTAKGISRIVVLDKEERTGVHSSGRNAAMVRQVTSDAINNEMTRHGAAAIREFASRDGWKHLFRPSGSLLLARHEKREQLEIDANDARANGLDVELWDAETTLERYPSLKKIIDPQLVGSACFCPSDGVVDIEALLDFYLTTAQERGAQVILGAGVSEVFVNESRVEGLRFGETEVRAQVVVNAAGGWARPIGDMAGAAPVPLRATRRHIYVTKEIDSVPPELPFVWDLEREVYFRPEAGGVMLSPCDEGHENRNLQTDEVRSFALRMLRAKVRDQFPGLADFEVARSWSGIRTLTEDGRLMIGPDPKLKGFFWAAGLGGHGLTVSSAVGELTAELIETPARNESNPHRPTRFTPERMREIAAIQRV